MQCLEFIQYIDGLIRSGQSAKARSELSRHRPHSFTRAERFELAAVARRAALPWLALRLLSPVVRPPSKKAVTATTREKAEYAAALVRVGAGREGAEILAALDSDEFPQVLLYRAHALFTQWEYQQAIPVLEQYLSKDLDGYQKLIGEINLASAYVHERHYTNAEKLLAHLEESTRKQNLSALYGNTLERLAELAIDRKEWTKAEHHLAQAEKAVEQAAGFDAFFVRKWRSILHLFLHPKRALPQFEAFRLVAVENRHWETVRECDAFRAIICQDSELFLKVYFGTPYASYRERLRNDFKARIEIPDCFPLRLSAKAPTIKDLDLLRDQTKLKPGQLKHRILRAMVSDFYRPARLAYIFSEIYPGQRFELIGSRARVHVGMRDLRNWLRTKRLPLKIEETQGEFRLVGTVSGLRILTPSPAWWQLHSNRRLAKVRECAADGDFSAAQVSSWLGIARRTAFDILSEALSKKQIQKTGAGPTTRYRFRIPPA